MKRENRYIVIKRKDLAPNVPLDTLEGSKRSFRKYPPCFQLASALSWKATGPNMSTFGS